jgi:hypothetical protein
MASAAQTRKGRRRSGVRRARGEFVAVEFGRERFRFTLRREQRRLPALNLDANVESCSWQRDDAVRSGTLGLRRPLDVKQAGLIAQGDRVLCEVDLKGTGAWRRAWMMTVDAPSEQVADGSTSLALKPELKALASSKAAFSYHDTDARRITLDIARRFHVQVGSLPAAKHRIDKLAKKSRSPVDMLDDAWELEHTATGRKFDVSISRGVIDVNELREPDQLLVLDRALVDATLERTLDEMASAVIVTSTRTVAGRKHKITVKVTDRARLKRYGYVVRHANKPGLGSVAAARRHGRETLARLQKPKGQITFTHPGLPFLDRGAVVRLRIPRAGFDEVVFVVSVAHDVSSGSYMMEVTVSFTDPWADARKDRAKRKRQAAARKRQRAGAKPAAAAKARKSARRS